MIDILHKTSAVCVTIIATIFLFDYNYSLLTSNAVLIIIYVLTVSFVSTWASFYLLRNILLTKEPFKLRSNKLLNLLHSPYADLKIDLTPKDVKPIDERITNFVDDIEQQFIKKWYKVYISNNDQFPEESKKLIDIIIRRFLQISGQINSEKVLHGIITILLRHVKEYKKCVKKTKENGGSVEGVYRYAHLGSKNQKCFEHFTLQIMAKVMRHFVNWELYNSVACRCLNAILAKKLISYIIHLVSAPGFINYKLMICFDKDLDKYLKYSAISISDVDHYCVIKGVNQNTESEIPNDQIDQVKDNENQDFDVVDEKITVTDSTKNNEDQIDTPVLLRNKKEVKVYESKDTNKTWRNSSDLDCISLGQDILFLSNIAEEDVKPDWNQLADNSQKLKKEIKTSVTVSVASSIASTAALITNIKPITSSSQMKDTMKDIQQSTSNAMHKIEESCEGILDLGMAGLKKGLRLTGLQDNIVESGPSPVSSFSSGYATNATRIKSESKDIPMSKINKTRLAKTRLSHVNSDEDEANHGFMIKKLKDNFNCEDSESLSLEDIYMNPLHPFSDGKLSHNALGTFDCIDTMSDVVTPGYEGDILLEKSPMIEVRTISNDSNASNDSNQSKSIPTMEIHGVDDSPEPEYEDNPDLATTIANLRSLLTQRTEANTPVATSPMSLIPTPQDASGSSVDDLSEVDGTSVYKAWAKNVAKNVQNTFNTIKTALPGNAIDELPSGQTTQPILPVSNVSVNADNNWCFEEQDSSVDENDFSKVLGRFLSERQAFCVVDNAFEAVETIDLSDQMDGSFILTGHEDKYDDELDDFDIKTPMTKAVVDLICELIEDTYPALVKEFFVKGFLLTYGCLMEEKLQLLSEQLIKCISYNIGHLPKMDGSSRGGMGMKIADLVEPIAMACKDVLGKWLSDESIKSILKLLLESLQSHKINVDTSLQILELFVAEVITACNQSSPTYSV